MASDRLKGTHSVALMQLCLEQCKQGSLYCLHSPTGLASLRLVASLSIASGLGATSKNPFLWSVCVLYYLFMHCNFLTKSLVAQL